MHFLLKGCFFLGDMLVFGGVSPFLIGNAFYSGSGSIFYCYVSLPECIHDAIRILTLKCQGGISSKKFWESWWLVGCWNRENQFPMFFCAFVPDMFVPCSVTFGLLGTIKHSLTFGLFGTKSMPRYPQHTRPQRCGILWGFCIGFPDFKVVRVIPDTDIYTSTFKGVSIKP